MTLAIGYLGEMIEREFGTGDALGLAIRYSSESRPLGTGGAARLALQETSGETILVLNGDTYAEFDVQSLYRQHLTQRAPLTMAVAQVSNGRRFAVVEVQTDGKVASYDTVGRDGQAWVSAGAYLVERRVLQAFAPGQAFSMETELIPQYVGAGLRAVQTEGPFVDIGTPQSLRGAAVVMKDLVQSLTDPLRVASAESIRRRLELSLSVKKDAIANCVPAVVVAGELIAESFRKGGKLLICGNGGSAADAQHVAAEFVGRLRKEMEREALPALALTTDTSFLTAYANDYSWDGVYARQIEAFGREGDVLLAISTSGSSANVLRGMAAARGRHLHTIALVGEGGSMAAVADVAVVIPSTHTGAVQETMLAIEHAMCEFVEDSLFGLPTG